MFCVAPAMLKSFLRNEGGVQLALARAERDQSKAKGIGHCAGSNSRPCLHSSVDTTSQQGIGANNILVRCACCTSEALRTVTRIPCEPPFSRSRVRLRLRSIAVTRHTTTPFAGLCTELRTAESDPSPHAVALASNFDRRFQWLMTLQSEDLPIGSASM